MTDRPTPATSIAHAMHQPVFFRVSSASLAQAAHPARSTLTSWADAPITLPHSKAAARIHLPCPNDFPTSRR